MKKAMNVITNINKRPFHERRQIAMFVITSLTALIVILWIATFAGSGRPNALTEKKETASPFAIIKNNVVEIYANAHTGYEEARKK
jgi:hypothetical protein